MIKLVITLVFTQINVLKNDCQSCETLKDSSCFEASAHVTSQSSTAVCA